MVFSTTVQVQHPNRLLPHEGVVLSTTNGHSPALESLYIAAKSRLEVPQGVRDSFNRKSHTSAVVQSMIGVNTNELGSVVWRGSTAPTSYWSFCLLSTCARDALSSVRAPSTTIASPCLETISLINRLAGSIFRRSVHQRNFCRGRDSPSRLDLPRKYLRCEV